MWFYAALLGALISGIITIFSKHTLKTISPIVFFWAVLLVSSPFILLFAWKDGIPSLGPGFIIGIAGSVILYSIARIVFYHVIKDAHLSQVYPLVTLGPIFTLVFAFVILSEKPTVYALFGSLITLAGTYVLNISSLREGSFVSCVSQIDPAHSIVAGSGAPSSYLSIGLSSLLACASD